MHDDLMVAVGSGAVALTDRRTRHTWTVELAPYLLAVVAVTQARLQGSPVNGPVPSVATTSRSNASPGLRPFVTATRPGTGGTNARLLGIGG